MTESWSRPSGPRGGYAVAYCFGLPAVAVHVVAGNTAIGSSSLEKLEGEVAHPVAAAV